MLPPVLDEHARHRISSNTSIDKPPGLADVLSISGGIAPINTAVARLSPCRADVAGDFAPAGRMTNMNRVLQVKLLDEFREMMINTVEEFSKKEGSRPGPRIDDRLKRRLARIGRSMLSQRLEIGLGVTAVAVPFVLPTIATKPSELCLKAAGLCLVLTGLGVRVLAAGYAGRPTRSCKIEGSKLAHFPGALLRIDPGRGGVSRP
jgi:hypothetical protein